MVLKGLLNRKVMNGVLLFDNLNFKLQSCETWEGDNVKTVEDRTNNLPWELKNVTSPSAIKSRSLNWEADDWHGKLWNKYLQYVHFIWRRRYHNRKNSWFHRKKLVPILCVKLNCIDGAACYFCRCLLIYYEH